MAPLNKKPPFWSHRRYCQICLALLLGAGLYHNATYLSVRFRNAMPVEISTKVEPDEPIKDEILKEEQVQSEISELLPLKTPNRDLGAPVVTFSPSPNLQLLPIDSPPPMAPPSLPIYQMSLSRPGPVFAVNLPALPTERRTSIPVAVAPPLKASKSEHEFLPEYNPCCDAVIL